jgi:RNA polymerase sigma-70 factor (ECF subfamily)
MAMGGRPDGGSLAVGYAGLVRVFFSRRCANREDVEDLSQEALCAIVAAAPRFRGDSQPSTWVYAICRNVWTCWLSRKSAERAKTEALGRELALSDTIGADCDHRSWTGQGIDPDMGVDLAAALGSLRASERRLYGLYYVEGKTVREIARLLERPEGTVKYLLSGLRARLRELLS